MLCALVAVVLLAAADALPTAQHDATDTTLVDRRHLAPIRRLGAAAGSALAFEYNASRGKRPPKASRGVGRRLGSPAATGRPTLRMVAEFEEMDGVLIRFPLGVSLELVAELSLHSRVVRVLQPAEDHQLSPIFDCTEQSLLLLLCRSIVSACLSWRSSRAKRSTTWVLIWSK